MVTNLALWFVILLITLFLAWVVTRAWRIRHGILKWPSVILAGLLTLVLAAVTVATGLGMTKIYARGGTPPQDLKVAGTPEQLQRGQHLATTFCVSCHSPNDQLPLIGGVDMGKEIPIPVGSFVSMNLTPGGPLKDWTDGEILRVLRQGVDRNGNKLLYMNLINVRYMSDDDLQSIIAFLRSEPAVDHPTQYPPDQVTLLGVLITGLGLLPSSNATVTGPIIAPPAAATAEYGKYVLSYQDCRGCHGANLTGGTSAIGPKGPSLRVVKGWTQAQFLTTLRTGVDPTGHQLQPPMPWKDIGKMDDTELGAVYQYLISLQ